MRTYCEETLIDILWILQSFTRSLCMLCKSRSGKTNVLIQAYISRCSFDAFSLVADTNYISQNIGRICRALFELCLRRGWPSLTETMLALAKACERRIWPHQHCLRQFETVLPGEVLYKLEEKHATFERLYDMSAEEIGSLLKLNALVGRKIRGCIDAFPNLDLSATVQPITRTVVRVQVSIEAVFRWKDSSHGSSQRWLLWVEDQNNEYIYHSESVVLTKKQAREGPLVRSNHFHNYFEWISESTNYCWCSVMQHITFSIPVVEPLPPEYYLRLLHQVRIPIEHHDRCGAMKFSSAFEALVARRTGFNQNTGTH